MKQNLITGAVMLCAIWAFFPATADAYFTTDQGAYEITDNTAFFTITYKFGGQKEDMSMPVMSMRGQELNESTKSLGFSILADSNEQTEDGNAVGLVLSNAKIENGMYVVPAGLARTFTLFVIYIVPDDLDEEDYSLLVTDLPFIVGENKRQLNPSELQYYITPEVSLNDE